MITFRDYESRDRQACLAIFDSNVPKFFAAEECNQFQSFLEMLPGPYLVMVDDNRIIGCGGWAKHRTKPNCAVLCWGMIHRYHHHSGFGRQLMEERLSRIADNKDVSEILLNTSQHSAGFFSRLGFVACKVVSNGHAPGIDLYEMSLPLVRG